MAHSVRGGDEARPGSGWGGGPVGREMGGVGAGWRWAEAAGGAGAQVGAGAGVGGAARALGPEREAGLRGSEA